ncbi:polymorphic toxin-type HINT domain-containing protein, partial [Paenibacillus algorifonticola]|uniref:polymorphic toxin-type HINT domain-containing protein n=1 Tax=Paenibacillus algorifonticola TaxID=684063 RepID=UPI003D2BB9A4
WAGSKLKNIFGEGTVKTTKKLVYECNCFTAGTKVLTDEGEKPIEEIEVGDKVLSKDDETGEVAYKEVVGLFQKQADEIYYVHIGDEVIEATGEHPFWLDGKGWTFVKDLKVGDLLVSSDGTKLAIDKIEKESREATVYNFEVEDYHSYFVSNLGIWVHNCAVKGMGKGLETRGYKPQPGERTFDGYVNKNVAADKETTLHTNSKGFNNNSRGSNPDGQFKRFGSDSHAGLSPHVHQPTRNVNKNGETFGGQGSKTQGGGVTIPGKNDVSQLYDYLNNGKYRR